MSLRSLLDLPVTVREQIYSELLVPPPPTPECHYVFRPADVSTGIMYTSRQIWEESSYIFYAKNLFVSIHCDPYISEGLPSKPPITTLRIPFLPLDNTYEATLHGRFAMGLEFLNIGRQSGRNDSRSCLVITAQALCYLMDDLARLPRMRPELAPQIIVARFEIHNTFRYAIPRFSELVFGSLISMQRLPNLKALDIRGPLVPSYRQRLMDKLLHGQDRIWFDFAGAFAANRSRLYEMLHLPTYDLKMQKVIRKLQLLLRALDVVWDFHSSLDFRFNRHYAQSSLFQSVADVYGMLVLVHLTRAKQIQDCVPSSFLDARSAAEQGIQYLNRDNRIVDLRTLENLPTHTIRENVNIANRAKAVLSLKASKACTKLGDRKAAAVYITDAHKKYHNLMPSSQELHLKLQWKKLPDSVDHSSPAIRWKERTA